MVEIDTYTYIYYYYILNMYTIRDKLHATRYIRGELVTYQFIYIC